MAEGLDKKVAYSSTSEQSKKAYEIESRIKKINSRCSPTNLSQSKQMLERIYKQLAMSHSGYQLEGEERTFLNTLDPIHQLKYTTLLAAIMSKNGMGDHANRLVDQYKTDVIHKQNINLYDANKRNLDSLLVSDDLNDLLKEKGDKQAISVLINRFQHNNHSQLKCEIYLDGKLSKSYIR